MDSNNTLNATVATLSQQDESTTLYQRQLQAGLVPDINTSRGKIDRLIEEKVLQRGAINRLRLQNAKLQLSLEELNEAITDAEGLQATLREEINTANRTIDEKEAEIQRLREEIKSLKGHGNTSNQLATAPAPAPDEEEVEQLATAITLSKQEAETKNTDSDPSSPSPETAPAKTSNDVIVLSDEEKTFNRKGGEKVTRMTAGKSKEATKKAAKVRSDCCIIH